MVGPNLNMNVHVSYYNVKMNLLSQTKEMLNYRMEFFNILMKEVGNKKK